MSSKNQKLYRYFSLPGNLMKAFEYDQIYVNENTTINDVLTQKSELQKKYYKKIIYKNQTKNQKITIEEAVKFKNLPEPYFSLYKINYLISDEMLYLSKLDQLNDISEEFKWMTPEFCENLIKKDENRSLSQEEAMAVKAEAEKFDGYLPFRPFNEAKYYGIVSFCRHNDKQAMWGLYANGLHGICVGFDLHENLCEIKDKMSRGEYLDKDGKVGSVYAFQSICYDHDAPQIWQDGILSHYQAEYNNILTESPEIKKVSMTPVEMAVLNSIGEKAQCWDREEEVRLFLTGHDKIQLKKFINRVDGKPNLLLDSIYFGGRVDEKLQALIRNSVSSRIAKYYLVVPRGGTFELKVVVL